MTDCYLHIFLALWTAEYSLEAEYIVLAALKVLLQLLVKDKLRNKAVYNISEPFQVRYLDLNFALVELIVLVCNSRCNE